MTKMNTMFNMRKYLDYCLLTYMNFLYVRQTSMQPDIQRLMCVFILVFDQKVQFET